MYNAMGEIFALGTIEGGGKSRKTGRQDPKRKRLIPNGQCLNESVYSDELIGFRS